jgi:hypothetical protein
MSSKTMQRKIFKKMIYPEKINGGDIIYRARKYPYPIRQTKAMTPTIAAKGNPESDDPELPPSLTSYALAYPLSPGLVLSSDWGRSLEPSESLIL